MRRTVVLPFGLLPLFNRTTVLFVPLVLGPRCFYVIRPHSIARWVYLKAAVGERSHSDVQPPDQSAHRSHIYQKTFNVNNSLVLLLYTIIIIISYEYNTVAFNHKITK